MRKAACWIVRQRRWILALTLILAAVCGVLIPGVQVNSDMTKYLPEDSQMRVGMRLMEAEFPAEEDTCTVRAMFGGLSPEQREKHLEELKELPHVSSVTYAPDSPDYNQGDWALYVLTTEYGYDTPEEAELERTLREDFGASVANDDTSAPEIPLTVYAVAFGVILLILLLACDSYFEPLLFLVTIGVAVALNLGTNYFLDELLSRRDFGCQLRYCGGAAACAVDGLFHHIDEPLPSGAGRHGRPDKGDGERADRLLWSHRRQRLYHHRRAADAFVHELSDRHGSGRGAGQGRGLQHAVRVYGAARPDSYVPQSD